jgi:hypothetical protein
MDFDANGQAMPGRLSMRIAVLLSGRFAAPERFPCRYHEEKATLFVEPLPYIGCWLAPLKQQDFSIWQSPDDISCKAVPQPRWRRPSD